MVIWCLDFHYQDGETALHLSAASKLEGLEKVRFLVELGVNVHTESEVSCTGSFLWIVCGSFVRKCSQVYRPVCTDSS